MKCLKGSKVLQLIEIQTNYNNLLKINHDKNQNKNSIIPSLNIQSIETKQQTYNLDSDSSIEEEINIKKKLEKAEQMEKQYIEEISNLRRRIFKLEKEKNNFDNERFYTEPFENDNNLSLNSSICNYDKEDEKLKKKFISHSMIVDNNKNEEIIKDIYIDGKNENDYIKIIKNLKKELLEEKEINEKLNLDNEKFFSF